MVIKVHFKIYLPQSYICQHKGPYEFHQFRDFLVGIGAGAYW